MKQFKIWVSSEHELPGLVTLHRDGRRINDMFLSLGEVFDKNKALEVHFDEQVAVANGAMGLGGRAVVSKGGGRAVAAEGRGIGGAAEENGMYGGQGFGGDAQGDTGDGGKGFGGMAANPNGGEVEAGDGVGGEFVNGKTKEAAARAAAAKPPNNGRSGWSFWSR